MRTFTAFDNGNYPYCEHDFVSVDHNGQRYFAKIDYYTRYLKRGMEDSGPAQKCVMTILRADNY